ncbi:MAG: selenocysteine-specific translation elongation factor [Actinomycetota bacterium]|nr:selenocysteine-specific translation elongation factor [Actinomycetota bacterium]
MPLIGTAGHVDHGKSSLIQRLTGRDPDRWAEEKRRGLTIDLGFAWTRLPSGTEVSFVDVPGHEKYLKNMLAGIEAVDIALFVVAADESWMPQSEEHLAVLDLLGVEDGVIALTKSDLVDDDLIGLASDEIREKLADTGLASARIIPMSSLDGEGVDAVAAELDRLIESVPARDTDRPRLWVDRVFSATGAGTVVTGTLLDGSLSVDDAVVIYPQGSVARTRGLQSHESAHQTLEPGRRVAINLGGVSKDDVERGDMVGRPEEWDTSTRFLARLETARYVEDFSRRGAFHLHMGSLAQPAEIVALEGTAAVIRTSRPIAMAVGDRFILRDTGRRLVTAGGVVLDPEPGATRPALESAGDLDPTGDPDTIASALLAIRGQGSALLLSAHSLGGVPGDSRKVGDTYISDAAFEEYQTEAARLVSTEHEVHPLRVGLPVATLAERLGADQEVVDQVVTETATLVQIGPDVAVAGREVSLPEDQLARWSSARDLLEAGLDVPSEGDLGLDSEVIHLLIRQGELVRLGPGLVMLPSQVSSLKEILGGMPDEFTVADFRDAAGLSRKYAVPILEWTDVEGLTVRRGDARTLR